MCCFPIAFDSPAPISETYVEDREHSSHSLPVYEIACHNVVWEASFRSLVLCAFRGEVK